MFAGNAEAFNENGTFPVDTQFPIAVYDVELHGTLAEIMVAWSALSCPAFIEKTRLLKSTWTFPPVELVVNVSQIELFEVKQNAKSSSHPGQKVLLAPTLLKENDWFGQISRAVLQAL